MENQDLLASSGLTPATLVSAVELLKKLGASIFLRVPDSYYHDISPTNIVEISKDRAGWLAKAHGVPRDQFIEWETYMENQCQCTGNSRSGAQCKRAGTLYLKPEEFVLGETDRCLAHVDVSS